MLCGTQAVSAQDVSARISGLEGNEEYMGLLRNDAQLRNREDSLIGVIRSVRSAMAANAEKRDSLAQLRSDSLLLMLSDTENAVFSLRMQKLKLVDRINAIEQNFVLSNMGDTGGQAQSDSGSSSFLTNPYFVKSIDPDDYKELLRVQKMEAETQDFVSAYMKNYEKIKSLYDRYMVAETEADAEAIYAELSAAMDDNIVVERRLSKEWSEIYDQKTYVYSYFLEKENREDLLDLTEKQLTALQEKLQSGAFTPAQPAKKAAKPASEPKQEAPKPAAPAVMTPTGKTDADAWKEAMNILKRSDPGTFAMLTMGKYAGCDGDTYRWQAPMGQELYVGLMNQEKKRTAIASALTQASGMQCHFEAIGAVKEKKADQSDESFLAALETTFGKANTMVQEDVKG